MEINPPQRTILCKGCIKKICHPGCEQHPWHRDWCRGLITTKPLD